MRAMAAMSVTGVPGAAVAAAPAPELPVARCRRLADELSLALDEWAEDVGSSWAARVLPASYAQYPVIFENINSLHDPVERFNRAKHELFAAFAALHPGCEYVKVGNGDEDGMLFILARKAVR